MTFKIVALVVILILLVLGYCLLVIAGEAEERADRMYKAWRMQSTDSNIDAENAKYTFRYGERECK